MLGFFVQAYMDKVGLPILGDEFTLKGVPVEGRVDVLLSEQIAARAASNPVTAAIHGAIRPYIDGLLTRQAGPQRLKAHANRLMGRKDKPVFVDGRKKRKTATATKALVRVGKTK